MNPFAMSSPQKPLDEQYLNDLASNLVTLAASYDGHKYILDLLKSLLVTTKPKSEILLAESEYQERAFLKAELSKIKEELRIANGVKEWQSGLLKAQREALKLTNDEDRVKEIALLKIEINGWYKKAEEVAPFIAEEMTQELQKQHQEELDKIRKVILDQDPIPSSKRYELIPLHEAVELAFKERFDSAVHWQKRYNDVIDQLRDLVTAIGDLNEKKDQVINA